MLSYIHIVYLSLKGILYLKANVVTDISLKQKNYDFYF